MLDLKDPFFCIPLHLDSPYLLAFEGTDLKTMINQQCTWTVLPQGFRDSPHLFAGVLEKDLRELHIQGGAILQCVDDILICSPTKKLLIKTIPTLNFLAERGSWVSKRKAQITKKVNYLGYILTTGSKQLSQRRIKAITELTHLVLNSSFAPFQEWQDSVGFGSPTLG